MEDLNTMQNAPVSVSDHRFRKAVVNILFILSVSAGFLIMLVLITLTDIDTMGKNDSLIDLDVTNAILSDVWKAGIALLILAILTLILSFRDAAVRQEDGTIRLSAFDRIWTEIQLGVGVAATFLLYPIMLLFTGWFSKSSYLNGFLEKISLSYYAESTLRQYMDEYASYNSVAFDPAWVLLFFAVVLTLGVAAVDLFVLHSAARKIIAREFWDHTLVGQIFRFAVRQLRRIYELYSSVNKGFALLTIGGIAAVILLSLLCCLTWLGVIITAVLAAVLIPLTVRRFLEIRRGAAEIRGGNLSYHIPPLGKGEFGKLANDINSIGDAQNLAIRNELRNQRLKTELITNVSHDLKTPLTSMVSYVDLLKTEGLDSENAPEYLNILEEKTSRLRRLTEDLFEAAKAASGDIPVNLESISMESILNQALAELEENLSANDLQVIISNTAEHTNVMADGRLLWRVIENLLTNVSKYALTGSRVYCNLSDAGQFVRLEVKNISRDPLNIDASELMERFKRGDESRNTEGSGLGLAIARDLTTLMGGRFDIRIDGDLFKAVVDLEKA